MHETLGTIEKDRVVLPKDVHLPDGLRVRVVWDDTPDECSERPYDREALTAEDVQADVAWATRRGGRS